MKKYMAGAVLMTSLLLTACSAAPETSTEPHSDAAIPSQKMTVPESTMVSGDQVQTLPEFSSIEIDVLAADIQVIPGEEWTVSYKLSEKEPVKRVGVEAGTLYVETSFDPKERFDHRENGFVTVTVPEGTTLSDVELETISGNVEVQGFTCDSASLSSTSGTVSAASIISREMDLESVSGDVAAADVSVDEMVAKTASSDLSMAGTFGDLQVDTVSGKINVTGTITAEGAMQSVSGEIALSLNHSAAIQANSVGKITWNGECQKSPVSTTGGVPVEIQSVSGDIKMQTVK